ELDDNDRQRAGHLLTARKSLERAPFRLAKETGAERGRGAREIAELAVSEHRPETQTLVVVNRVDRAQAIFRALRTSQAGITADHNPALLLLHARFRPAERRRIEAELRRPHGPA